MAIDFVQQRLDAMRAMIADNRREGAWRWRWFDSDVEELLGYIDRLRAGGDVVARLRARIVELHDGTQSKDKKDRFEVDVIHATLAVVLSELDCLSREKTSA